MSRLTLIGASLLFFIFVSCKEDCGQLNWFLDNDGDGYGNPADTLLLIGCNRPKGYVLDNTDCDDSNPDIHPNAPDDPTDGIDSDCSAAIWTGPMLTFTKENNADWTLPENQDKLTDNVIFTRQNRRQLYNYRWWQDKFAQDVGDSDLGAEFWNDPTILDFIPSGGTQGVRWAILDDTGADNPWDPGFALYGTIGDSSNFYSFHSVASMIRALNDGMEVTAVNDDFEITADGSIVSGTVMTELVGKNLGLWLVEGNVYLTLTFTNWGRGNGGSVAYTRSTPPEE